MSLQPDESRLRMSGTTPPAAGERAASDLRFLDLDIRVEAPPDDLLWLEEFLGPAFSTVTTKGRSRVDVVLRIDRDRVDGWLADGPTGADLVAFRLDQGAARLPILRTIGGERLAWDERSAAIYAVQPAVRRVEVWCREPGKKARRALMRAVRELAIDHGARSHGVLLHASCLDSGSGALAFSGPKGCGKTTLLIAALAGTGSALLANDRLFVDLSRDPPQAVSLPSIVSVRASSARLFPELAVRLHAKRWSPWVRWQDLPDQPASAPGTRKDHQGMSPFQFRRWLECESSGEAPLRLLVVPRVESGRSEPRIRRLSPEEIGECLPRLLFSSGAGERSELFSLDQSEPAWKPEATHSLLAERLPVVELCLPLGRPESATWFDDLMRHAAAAP